MYAEAHFPSFIGWRESHDVCDAIASDIYTVKVPAGQGAPNLARGREVSVPAQNLAPLPVPKPRTRAAASNKAAAHRATTVPVKRESTNLHAFTWGKNAQSKPPPMTRGFALTAAMPLGVLLT